jgi:molybdopterin converting factor small subunit
MKIKVRVFGNLKDIIGAREVILDVPEKVCLKELPHLLENRYGIQLRDLIGDQKQFLGFRILINGIDDFTLGGLNFVLNEGDTVTLLPPLMGG